MSPTGDGTESESGILATFQELSPYASALGTVWSIGAGLYGSAQDSQRWAEINLKLDKIAGKLSNIEDQLSLIHGAVTWGDLVKVLADHRDYINNKFKLVADLAKEAATQPEKLRADWENRHKSEVERWATETVDREEGIRFHLPLIDAQMRGDADFATSPLMKGYDEKVGKTQQSRYYGALTFFERWLLIQWKALIALGNAYIYTDHDNVGATLLRPEHILNFGSLIRQVWQASATTTDPLASYLLGKFEHSTWSQLNNYVNHPDQAKQLEAQLRTMLLGILNAQLIDPLFYQADRFANVQLSAATQALLTPRPTAGSGLIHLNRSLLAEAYPYEIAKGATVIDAMEFLEPSAKVDTPGGSKISIFESQANFNKPFFDGLDAYYHDPDYQNRDWGRNEGVDFLAFSDGYQPNNVRYWDTNEVVAESGMVVVGLSLWWKGNRIGLRIFQSVFEKGKVRQGSAIQADRQEMNDNYLEVREGYAHHGQKWRWTDNHYVDLNEVEVPAGQVVTGAGLYQKGNRIAIKLRANGLDSQANIDSATTHWVTPNFTGDNDGVNFMRIAEHANYASLKVVQPQPKQPIRAAKFSLYGGDPHQSWRLFLSVKPGIVNTGDLWKRADVVDIDSIWRKYELRFSLTDPAVIADQPQSIGTT